MTKSAGTSTRTRTRTPSAGMEGALLASASDILESEGPDGLHPLLAIYEPVLLEGLQSRLAQGQRSMQDWIRGEELPTWTLPSLDWVYNINTKADWERWRRGPS